MDGSGPSNWTLLLHWDVLNIKQWTWLDCGSDCKCKKNKIKYMKYKWKKNIFPLHVFRGWDLSEMDEWKKCSRNYFPHACVVLLKDQSAVFVHFQPVISSFLFPCAQISKPHWWLPLCRVHVLIRLCLSNKHWALWSGNPIEVFGFQRQKKSVACFHLLPAHINITNFQSGINLDLPWSCEDIFTVWYLNNTENLW